MNHYLFGQFHHQELDLEAVSSLLKRGQQSELMRVPVREIVDLLDRVGSRWLDPNYPLRQAVCQQLPSLVGFSQAMVEKGLEELGRLLNRHTLMKKTRVELGRLSSLDGWVWKEGYEGYLRALPLGIVTHVSPGNVFLGAADSLVHGLLTKNTNLLKVASGDPVFPLLFARSLLEADTDGTVAQSFSILSFGRESKAVSQALKQGSDGLVVWGGAQAVKWWSQDLPGSCRLIPYGPRFSFALARLSALDSADARSLALDMVMWEQRACASPQVLFVEGEVERWRPFLTSLGQELEALSVTLPQGQLELDQKIEIRRERELAHFAGECQGPETSFRWTILVRDWKDHHTSPLNRTLVVVPFSEIAQIEEWLRPYRHQLQTAGLSVAPPDWRALSLRLTRLGVTRVTEFGKMHLAKHGAPHDGTFQLSQLVRWATIESLPRRFDAGKRLRPPPPSKTRKLASLIEYARAHSPFYREHLPEMLITQARDVEKLPTLTAETLRLHTPPLSRDLLTGPLEGAYVFASGGSTGAPKFCLYSYEEWEEVTDTLSAIYLTAGLEAGDTVGNLFMAGNLWTSFLAASQALQKLGCVTLPIAGNAPVTQVMEYLKLFRPTVLLGLPSLIVRVAEEVARSRIDLKVPKVLYGGEHFSREAKRFIGQALGAERVISAGYASVDAGPIGFQTAPDQGGVHHLLYDYQFLEFLDPDTGQPVPSGQVGEVVVTCLKRRLMPLIRYRTGDLGRWVDEDRWILELKGRIGDRVRVGTADLYPDDISQALDGLAGVSRLFQLVIDGDGAKDCVTVLVEKNGIESAPSAAELERAIRERSQELDEALTEGWLSQLQVKLLEVNELPRVQRTGKVRAIVDKRSS